jgi:hypothetical protein
MKTEKLNEAISFVRTGQIEDARQILFEYIRNDPENEVAWIWLAETLSSNQDRMKIYRSCLDINPESKIVNMAIARLKSMSNEDFPVIKRVKPFSEEGTFDPSARERTGHTGALIGQDGSFILTNVPDFDEVIDLRTPVDKTLDERFAFMLNSEPNPARISGDENTNPTKELDYEPDLSDLLEDEIFADPDLNGGNGTAKNGVARVNPVVDDAVEEEIASLLDKRLLNGAGSPNPHEAETTPLEKNMPESLTDGEIDPIFTPSLADSFLKDDQTGDLAAPDEAFSYDFVNENDVELDYEPDLTSFLATEKIDVKQSGFSPRSISAPLEESDDDINLEDIPLQDELSVEELGFAGWSQKPEPEMEEIEKPIVIFPPPPVEQELADEFEFDDAVPDETRTKRTRREIVLIGGTALLLLLVLSVISVFAFPGVFAGISGKTPTPTFAGILLEPTAEKIVLPPVVTNTLPLLANGTPGATETPAPTASETAVVILLPSNTATGTATVTPTGTRPSTMIATRTHTRTATYTQVPASTRTATPTRTYTSTTVPTSTLMPTNTSTSILPTNTSVSATNTPTTHPTLIPTITPLPPTSTPVPPTNTPLPPTDTPPPPTATP